MWSDSTTLLSEMREVVSRFIEERDWGRYHHPVNVASAMTVEAGELVELFQWRRPGDPVPGEVVREAGAELADVLHFTLCLVNALDLQLDSDGRTLSQQLEGCDLRGLTPKGSAEEVMIGTNFVLMSARASDLSREIAETLKEGGAEDAMRVSIEFLLAALAKGARTLGLDLSRQLELKNRINEDRFPVGTMPDVGY